MKLRPNVFKALQWIIEILNQLNIPYQITGGLAARCYGSTRPLHDIDFYVPGKFMSKLERELSDYIEFGPSHYKNEYWDIIFIKLSYKGQQIEFGDADNTRYFNAESQQWVKERIDFSKSFTWKHQGLKLAVMPKHQLIEYKRRLNRKVDQADLNEILS